MHLLFLYLGALLISVMVDRAGLAHEPRSVLMLPLIVLDCAVNGLLGGSLRHTLSASAWHNRTHKYFGWCHRAIDAIFFWDRDHCRVQSGREDQYGSVWNAWRYSFNGGQ